MIDQGVIRAMINRYVGRLIAGKQDADATLTSLSGLSLVSGDVLYATGADTLARLAVGADGQHLTVASGIPAWASRVALQPAIPASSQTSIDFTGIPAWVNRIAVMPRGISTNGTSPLTIRVGDGAFVSTGYLGAVTQITGATPASLNATSGCDILRTVAATSVFGATCFITRQSGNIWTFSGTGAFSSSATTTIFSNEIALSGALDRVGLTTLGGTDTFDAGSVNISWE